MMIKGGARILHWGTEAERRRRDSRGAAVAERGRDWGGVSTNAFLAYFRPTSDRENRSPPPGLRPNKASFSVKKSTQSTIGGGGMAPGLPSVYAPNNDDDDDDDDDDDTTGNIITLIH